MKRIAAGVLAVAACGSALLVQGTAGAAASPSTDLEVSVINVVPYRVQLPADGRPTKVIVNVAIKNASRVEVSLKPLGFGARGTEPKQARTFDRGDRLRFAAFFNKNDKPGKWLATAVAFDKFGHKTADSYSFFVDPVKQQEKVDTEIRDFEVTPGLVRRGRSVLFEGVLAATESRFKGIRDQEVGIYFRSSRRQEWKLVTETETNRFGRFSAKARAFKSGEYRAVFEGNEEANGSESDVIRVRVRGFGHGF
ncbi:hypothetical protein AB0K60_07890 [Thermopolyspora sp. NPDC052614]|uniref:hypothetical protein n=1 Tax=Thermopolyspora sp. NPDC052614 TaxID=3155682 RepID=UPI0034478B70